MDRFQISQQGAKTLYVLTIVAMLAVGTVAISKYFVPSNAQPLRPTDGLSNIVRGYIAVSVGGHEKASAPGKISAVAGPATTAASFNQPPARSVAPKDIYLPGVTVFLEDPQTQKRSNIGRTDLSGRFTLYAPEPGRYRICWESDVYGNGCTEVFISAGSSPQFLSTVHITIPGRQNFVAMTGHVMNRDGSLPRAFDPLMNINAFAMVSLDDDNANRLAKVYVNNFGDYLLPYVPVRQKIKLTASIEAGKYTQEVRPEAEIERAPEHQVNLRIENSRPILNPLVAADSNNRRVQNAAPGSEISIDANARDDDGDVVKFAWFVDPSAGQLSQISGSRVKWRLPQAPGRYTITVAAYDKKGGYDKAVLSVLAGFKGIPFTGIVVEQDGTPIDQAEVEIFGNPIIKTGPNGRFSTYAIEADRYVVNVRKPGYALNSQVYDRALTGSRWILRRAQVITIDPTRDQIVTHERTQADCPGPDSARAGLGAAGDSLKEPQWQDGGGHVIDSPSTICATCSGPAGQESELFVSKRDRSRVIMPRDLKLPKCGPGVRVEIPANSILDPNGLPATTPIPVTIATVDLLSPQQMPGDGSVLSTGGGVSSLRSFGAGSLDLPSGFKLKSGALAKVIIPVDRARLMGSTLPPTVPLLSYDEQKGLWIEEGLLTLSVENGVKAYVGNAKHFSPMNADTLFNNNACLRVFSLGIANAGVPVNYDLEVMSPGPDGTPHTYTFAVDNVSSQEHVIYNLTPNVNVTLAPITPASQGPKQLLGFYVVNSGPVTPFVGNSGVGNSPPGPPYLDCKNFVVLKTDSAPDSPFGGEFLHGLGFIDAANLGFDDLTAATPTGVNALRDAIVTAAQNYYTSIDPNTLIDPTNDRDTFAKFKTKNGFDQNPNNIVTVNSPGAGEFVAQYANSGDLGFGRDMHCLKKTNGDIACYVTNYGDAGTDDHNDADAAGARSTATPGPGVSAELATVAMEYSPIEGDPSGDRVVKFFVYKKNFPNPGDYGRSISANLDGRGERPVPQLCMICHGGQIPQQSGGVAAFGTAAQVKLNSRFLPFDYRLFTFPASPALPATTQDSAIKSLNETIVDAIPTNAPSTDPIREVVNALYNDATHNNSPTQLLDSPVLGWQTGTAPNFTGQPDFYNKVVANACRVCHTAQAFEQLQFNTSERFVNLAGVNLPPAGLSNKLMLGTAQLRVCGDYLMPHALRTHDIFWGNYPDLSTISPTINAITMRNEFQTFGNGIGGSTWKAGLCNSFVSTLASTPSNFYQQSIQPIWNGKCVACHIVGGQFAFLPLTDGASHGGLVPARVVPGNDNPNAAGNELLRRLSFTDPRDPNFAPSNAQRMPKLCVMPPNPPSPGQLPCLTQSDIDRIKAWIRSGAN